MNRCDKRNVHPFVGKPAEPGRHAAAGMENIGLQLGECGLKPAGTKEEGQRILGADIQFKVGAAVLLNLIRQPAAGGDDRRLMPAFDQFTAEFDYAALDASLIQFRQYLDNVHVEKLAVCGLMFEVLSCGI